MSVSISEILTRQVQEILPSKKGLEGLLKKRKIRVYLGVDPTSPLLHLGHTIPLRKLRQFQNLGHEVILLFGTFTAQIGDPSGRDATREPLGAKEIVRNMRTYKKQAEKILDAKKITYKKNGEWLGKLKFKDILEILSHLTISQLLERDMFQERIKKGNEVWVHEFLYPVMQGYDSVAMDVDLEVGATDQTFNMLVGRKLQKVYRNKEKFILTTPLLMGLDGRKMSKTYGNAVNLTDVPEDMYGKLMSLKDELIIHYFELCADISDKEIQKLKKQLKTKKISLRDAKARLARRIVALYHGTGAAGRAEKEFERVFRQKRLPSRILTVAVKKTPVRLADILVLAGFFSSISAARRVIEQGGVRINREVKRDWKKKVRPQKGMIIQIGKRNVKKIV